MVGYLENRSLGIRIDSTQFIFTFDLLGMIGYAPTFNEVVNFDAIGNTDDDQLYYTRIYLKHRVRFDYIIASFA